MGKAKRLQKKLSKLSRDYDKAEGKPLLRARILKSANATQTKLDSMRRT